MIGQLIRGRSKLSAKLAALAMLIFIVVFSIYGYFSTTDLMTAIDEQYRCRALSVIFMMNAAVDTEGNISDKKRIQQICDNIVRIDSNILKVSLYIIDDAGKVIRLASSDHEQIGKEADLHDATPIKTGKTV